MDTFKSFQKPVKQSEEEKFTEAIQKRFNMAKRQWEKRQKEKEEYIRLMGYPNLSIKRPKRRVLRKKRVKLPSIRSLILKADTVFSLFIRNRDKKCVLCGKVDSLTNGHLVKRGKKQVRWDELNCHCLCMGCNYKDNFDHDVYVVWFIKNYGALPYQDLVEKSRGVFKPSREFLNNIIQKYKDVYST